MYIVEDNKASTSVDRWERSDRDSPFGSRKSGIKISVDFGQNVDDKIAMNLSRSIRSLNPQIISNKLRNCNIFNSVSRVFLWHGKMKKETGNIVENPIDNTIFKTAERENNYEVGKVGQNENWKYTYLIIN